MALIAQILIVAGIDGKRVEFQPGETVTGLTDHDVRELKKSGALVDEVEQTAARRKAASLEAKGRREFENERQLIAEANASVVVPESGDGDKAKSESSAAK